MMYKFIFSPEDRKAPRRRSSLTLSSAIHTLATAGLISFMLEFFITDSSINAIHIFLRSYQAD